MLEDRDPADPCCSAPFWSYLLLVAGLVGFSGLMAGLSLGLTQLGRVDLEVIQRSGKPTHRKYAERILPVIEKPHLLLVTLLICNSAAMELIPLTLDYVLHPAIAIGVSVVLILTFGEVIPKAICSRYGLVVGAMCTPFVRVLVVLLYPVAYPISLLMDRALGDNHGSMFQRDELKTLIDMHSKSSTGGGELSVIETKLIYGALDLSQKTAGDAMTHIANVFSIDMNAKLDRNLRKLIARKGYSRIPVYLYNSMNIVGYIRVKSLLEIPRTENSTVSDLNMRKLLRIPEGMQLYHVLEILKESRSRIAAVVRYNEKSFPDQFMDDWSIASSAQALQRQLQQPPSKKSFPDRFFGNLLPPFSRKDGEPTIKIYPGESPLPSPGPHPMSIPGCWKDQDMDPIEVGEVLVGIITLEDVIEELMQDEIFDETDHPLVNVDLTLNTVREARSFLETLSPQSYNTKTSRQSSFSTLAPEPFLSPSHFDNTMGRSTSVGSPLPYVMQPSLSRQSSTLSNVPRSPAMSILSHASRHSSYSEKPETRSVSGASSRLDGGKADSRPPKPRIKDLRHSRSLPRQVAIKRILQYQETTPQ